MDVDRKGVLEIAQHWKKNEYYDRAEKQDWVEPFWNETSPFRTLFKRLDLSCVVELACGHGRHTAQVLSDPSLKPTRIILMDINRENVDFSIKRFAGRPNIRTIINNGMDFEPLEADSVTSIFCFDAMVHFEYDCVISYIEDAFRILQKDGRALFHHSNYTKPGSAWLSNPHCRNFMSRDLFAHVAMRTGFKVLDQIILNWGEGEHRVEQVDCLSLLEKPASRTVVSGSGVSLPNRLRARVNRWRGAR